MALFHNLRYKQYILKAQRRLRSFLILAIIGIVLFGASTLLKNLVLNEVRKRIESTLHFERAYIQTFPPALVIEDVRSVSSSPFFSARRIEVKVTFRSLLSRERPFVVFVDNPTLRIFAAAGGAGTPINREASLALPFMVDRGLIRGGEVYYWGKETRVFAQGINAIFRQSGRDFSLKAVFTENTFTWDSKLPSLSGRVELALEGSGDEIHIQKLRIVSPGGVVKASGRLTSPFDPEFELETSYNLRIDFIADQFALPFTWKGRGAGKGVFRRSGERLSFQGSVEGRGLELNGVPMGYVDGSLSFQEASGLILDLNMRKPGRDREYLRLRIGQGRVEGIARGVYLDPVIKDFELPWPVASPAWGTFTVVNEYLTADAEFRDELELRDPERFPFNGEVHVEWDGVDTLLLRSEDLDSSFARVELEGTVKVDQEMDLTIRGDIKDATQARRFTELILEKEFEFPEIGGSGEAEIRIFGDALTPQVNADFSMRDAWFDHFSAGFIKGEAEVIRESFFGRFEVDDPLFTGRIGLYTDVDEVRTEIWVDKGEIETILRAMDVQLPLRGMGSGHFLYQEKDRVLAFEGDFSGERIDLAGQVLSGVRGTIEGDAESIRFPELEFDAYGGHVQGTMSFRPLEMGFDVDLKGEDFDLSLLYPSLQGEGALSLQGTGTFGQDVISGTLTADNLQLSPFQPTRTQADFTLDYGDDVLRLDLKGGFFPGDNAYTVELGLGLNEDTLTGDIKGSFTNMGLLLPWPGAKARIDYQLGLRGPRLSPEISGWIDIQGTVLPFPRFAHAFRDFSGLVFVRNGELSIRSLQGTFGGGEVNGSGSLSLGKGGLERIDVTAEARDMVLSLMERTAARIDGSIRLLKDADRFVLEGDFLAERVNWKREVTEKFAFATSAYEQARPQDDFFNDLTLNIRLRATDDAWMDNTLGRLRTRFDLTISGNIFNPVLFGDIEVIDGSIEFQDRSFEVIHGRISFFNPALIEPYFSFQVETFIKDYRVTIKAEGLADRDMSGLDLELTSSPPLPPEDVLTLISLGESFQRTYHYDQSRSQGTASLLTFTLSEEAKRSAERLFSVDQFRLEPYILGSSSEVAARLTVGKRLSRNFFIQYATNLSTERKDIVRMEFEISRDLSIVGIRDENGRLSVDVKIHKRFR